MKKPNLFIVGAPKSGTTSMHYYLGQHPDIYMPKSFKEPNFFGRDLKPMPLSLEAYLSFFSDAKSEKYLGEATTWYLYSHEAAKNIKEFSPSARIIMMLRDPIDMIYSLHSQQIRNGCEDIFDFESALDAEPIRKQNSLIHPPNLILLYKEIGKYAEQVKRYLDIFPKENVHIIIYDDFRQNTQKSYLETLEFLGLETNKSLNFDVHNKNFSQLLPPQYEKKIRSNPVIRNSLKILSSNKRIYQLLRRTYHFINPKFPVTRKPLNEGCKVKLQSFYSEDIKQLSALVERDLESIWLK
jgi:hypothetical protein